MRAAELRIASATAALLLLAGCVVGPDFARPAAPQTSGYTPDPLTATAGAPVRGGEPQRFVQERDIPGQWWMLFHSASLNALIEEALKANPSLQAAEAALRQAQENVRAANGVFFPTVTGNLSSTREKISGIQFGNNASSLFSLNTASLNVSYPLDVFGGERRQLEALGAQVDYERFQLEAAYLTLTANLVATVVQEASLRGQITANQDIVAIDEQELNLLRQQLALGGVAKTAVLAQAAALEQARSTVPPLEKQLAQTRNQLTDFLGRFPSEAPGESFDLASLQLPEELPVSLPSKLVEQRPDVLAAESQLHAASAQIGVATANQFPQFNITGSLGSTALTPGGLFSPGTGIWSIGASAAQTLFDAGTLLHKKRAAIAAFDQAAAQYRVTVLAAFQNVADALRALQSDANALSAQVGAERAAADSLELARQQFRLGAITYLALLNAEQTYQQTRIGRVQAQANRFADTAALFQALGGGWWNRADVPAAAADRAAQ